MSERPSTLALDAVPEDKEYQPDGIATARIDRKTGKLAVPGAENSVFEFFREEYLPLEYAESVEEVTPVPVSQPRAEVVFTSEQSAGNVAGSVTTSTPQVVPPPKKQADKKKLEQLF